MKGTLRVVEGPWELAYDMIDVEQFLTFKAAGRAEHTDTSVEDAVADELASLQCRSNRQAYGGGCAFCRLSLSSLLDSEPQTRALTPAHQRPRAAETE